MPFEKASSQKDKSRQMACSHRKDRKYTLTVCADPHAKNHQHRLEYAWIPHQLQQTISAQPEPASHHRDVPTRSCSSDCDFVVGGARPLPEPTSQTTGRPVCWDCMPVAVPVPLLQYPLVLAKLMKTSGPRGQGVTIGAGGHAQASTPPECGHEDQRMHWGSHCQLLLQ